MKTMTMYTVALLIACFSLTACGPKGSAEGASPQPPKSVSPAPQTTIVIIKNSVVGEIVQLTAPGLSSDLKLQCNVSSGIVYCNTLEVLP